MKKLVLLATLSACSLQSDAQPWVPSNAKLHKFEDIVRSYESSKEINAEEENHFTTDGEKEGNDNQFERWKWYWERHLDENGYMVSPRKTFDEWISYKNALKNSGAKYKTTNQSQWTFEGPSQTFGGNKGQGRVNVIEFHPTNANTYIVGAAGGGAWRTTNDGVNWTPLYNDFASLGVSDIDYNPQNPNTIFLCTGDRDATDNYSIGLMVSYDGGVNWNTTGLQYSLANLNNTNCLVINPLDTNSMTIATGNGILKSFDAGNTWQSTIGGDFKQVVYNPADTNILYAASFASGNSNIYRSADGGLSWQAVTSLSNSRRIVLAVTPANPRIVKAVVANNSNGLNGIYSSSDTGKTFTKKYGGTCNTNILNSASSLSSSTCDGQGWYDLCIAISPVDSNKVVVGGINTWQSSNGGSSWTIINQAYGGAPGVASVHADKHYLAYHPLNPGTLYECNDGGVYKTSNITLWSDLSNGLNITQFYRNAVADVATFVIGGAQDNGTKRVNFNNTAAHLTGGDGMDCQIDYSSASIFYTASQYGSINRTTNGGSSYSTISSNIPGNPTGDWITPYIIHPIDPTILLAGYDHLFASYNRGNSWTDISTTLPTGTKIKRIAMSPADYDRIFILSGTSTLRYTSNFGSTWTSVPVGYSGTVSDIHVDPKNKDLLWVTYSGYTNARVATFNVNGNKWSLKNDGLPNVPVNCITIDSSNATVYVGTDVAVFYRDWTMANWALFNSGLPSAEVTDLGINHTTNEIWAATYGRGMWKSPKDNMTPNGIANVPMALDVISVFPNPNNGEFTISTSNKALHNQPVEIRIISYIGATVQFSSGKFENGNLKVNSSQMARGTYFVEINKNGNLFARTKMAVL